jgi:hypothetical protein
MPSGLADGLSVDDLASLLAFVAGNSPPPKMVAGNRPGLVEPRTDGTIRLEAANAEIYGGDLTFEAPSRNIVLWHDENDFVICTLRVPSDGRYEVTAEWACHDNAAGDAYVIEGGAEPLRGRRLRHRRRRRATARASGDHRGLARLSESTPG